MIQNTGQDAWLTLATTAGIGAGLAARLLARFGDPARALAAGEDGWREAGLPAPARQALAAPDVATRAATRDWLAQPDHYFLSRDDRRYPPALDELAPPPPWLFAIGDPDLLQRPAIAIVGSRNPSHAGREAAFEFGHALAAAGLVVVSGLALGIDAAAHEGALAAGGMTIAVTGTGLDRVYPAANKPLAERIGAQGLLVSEFALGTEPARGNFPRRNRAIAGLCSATLVVEAARASSSLITAREAAAANREVFAMPGSIHNPLARGCHQLIRDGAKLVETTTHILEEIAPSLAAYQRPAHAEAHAPAADADAGAALLAALGDDPVGVGELVAHTGWSADAVSSTLLILELEGRIQTAPGGGAYVRSR